MNNHVRYQTLTLYGHVKTTQQYSDWYTGHWWVGCYIWYSEEGTGQCLNLPRPLLAVQNVTAHTSTDSVPITTLVYNGPFLCGFNVPIKGLMPLCVTGHLPTQDQSRRLRLWVRLYRLPETTPTIAIYYYYSARKLILILRSHKG